MREIIAITPVELNPQDTKPGFDEIATRIGFQECCDGRITFDVFICYREASDAFYADRLYVHLKSLGIKPFLLKRSWMPDGSDYLEYGKFYFFHSFKLLMFKLIYFASISFQMSSQ